MSLKAKLRYLTQNQSVGLENQHSEGRHKANAPSVTDLKGKRQSSFFQEEKENVRKVSRVPSH